MTVMMFEGFENQRLPAGITISGMAGNYTASYATPGRTGLVGSYQFRIEGNATASRRGIQIALGSVSTVQVGLAMRFGGAPIAGDSLIELRENTNIHLAMRLNSTSGLVEVIRGDNVVLGTATLAVDFTQWNHFTFLAVIADGTAGSFQLLLNGSPFIAATGVDTRNGGTGVLNNAQAYQSSYAYSAAYFDDVYVSSSSVPLGDCVVECLRPNGNGASSQWVGSDGNSIDNYLLVDDAGVVTDYVGAVTSGDGLRDVYAMADLSSSAKTPLAIQNEVYAAKSDPGTAVDLLEVTRSGATDRLAVMATAAQLTTTYQWFKGAIQSTDPTGVALSAALVNGVQVGVEVGPL